VFLEAVWTTGDDGVVNAEASMRARWPTLLVAARRVLSIFAFALLTIVLLCAFTLGVRGNLFSLSYRPTALDGISPPRHPERSCSRQHSPSL
jgi:hypothetical protein